MDDSLQQALALGLVVLAVIAELLRRDRKKQAGKPGCDGCETGTSTNKPAETPLRFYERKSQHGKE